MLTNVPPPTSPYLTVVRLARLIERGCGPDLTLAQYRALAFVASADERASRLAHRLSVAKPTVTALIEGLVERGLVTRRLDPADRRVVQVAITPAGQEALRQAEARIADAFGEVLARCADGEAVLDAVAQLSDALDARADDLYPVPAVTRK
jgi:long-chain acyl-CoA synthetase